MIPYYFADYSNGYAGHANIQAGNAALQDSALFCAALDAHLSLFPRVELNRVRMMLVNDKPFAVHLLKPDSQATHRLFGTPDV